MKALGREQTGKFNWEHYTMIETLEQKHSLPRWRRILLWLVLTAMVLLGLVILASYIVGRRLGAEIVKISEAGEPLTFSDLAKANSPESTTQEDAARYYI
jgi:sensor histidine kinase YesM